MADEVNPLAALMQDDPTIEPGAQAPIRITVTPGAANSSVERRNIRLTPVDHDPFNIGAGLTNPAVIDNRNPLQKLLGIGGERFQTWPERMVRSGSTLAGDMLVGLVNYYPGVRREDVTDIPPAQGGGQGGLAQLLGFDPKPVQWQPNDPVIERAQDTSGLMLGGSLPGVAVRGVAPSTLGVVPVARAKQIPMDVRMPEHPAFAEAVANSGFGTITPDGLALRIARAQHSGAAGNPALAGSVFYGTPKGTPGSALRLYKHGDNPARTYGGSQIVEGETLVKRPMFVKGGTGGGTIRAAAKQLFDDTATVDLMNDLRTISNDFAESGYKWDEYNYQGVENFLNKWAPGVETSHSLANLSGGRATSNIVQNTLMDAAVTSAARNAGYDSIIGHWTTRGKPHLSEFVDLRESHYPTPDGGYEMHPQFLSDTGTPGAPLSALAKQAKDAPAFYSAVERAIESAPQDKMTHGQWLGWLRNQPGVKAEELEWLGLTDPAEFGKGPVTRQQLLDHADARGVKIREVEKKGDSINEDDIGEGADRIYRRWGSINDLDQYLSSLMVVRRNDGLSHVVDQNGVILDVFTTQHRHPENALQKTQRDFRDAFNDPDVLMDWSMESAQHGLRYYATSHPKYSDYQLPGGTNYREVLLTLPEGPAKFDPGQVQIRRHMSSTTQGETSIWYGGKEIARYGDNPELNPQTGSYDQRPVSYWTDVARQLYERGDKINKIPAKSDVYRSSHWDEPNVLVHLRMNDRQLPLEPTPEYLAAKKAHDDVKARIEANNKEQNQLIRQLTAARTETDKIHHAAVLDDLKNKKITVAEARRKVDELVPLDPELQAVQTRLRELREEADQLAVTWPMPPEPPSLKALHLEEVQSDWHQQGRKKGYTKPSSPDDYVLEGNGPWVIRNKKSGDFVRDFNHKEVAEGYLRDIKLGKVLPERKEGQIPDAPFKATWADLALKKAISKAAREGYDAISWTPGAQQAERYNLSKRVEIDYRPVKGDRENDPKYWLNIRDKNTGHQLKEMTVSESELENLIGKDAAKRVVDGKGVERYEPTHDSIRARGEPTEIFQKDPSNPDNAWYLRFESGETLGTYNSYSAAEREAGRIRDMVHEPKSRTLKDDDLAFGGTGMKGFYDKMLVDKANAIAKKFGGKVEWKPLSQPELDLKFSIQEPPVPAGTWTIVQDMPGGWSRVVNHAGTREHAEGILRELNKDADKERANVLKVPVLRLTDKMKEAATRTGMPLFARGFPHTLTPVDYDPFDPEGRTGRSRGMKQFIDAQRGKPENSTEPAAAYDSYFDDIDTLMKRLDAIKTIGKE